MTASGEQNNLPPDESRVSHRLERAGLLDGRYEIIDVLGKGGMGTVLKARLVNLNKLVAIKVLNASSFTLDEVTVRRFQLEAKAGSKLSHPHLVAVFDYGVTEAGEPYLVMEHVEGESLEQKVSRLGKLSTAEVKEISMQICKALNYIHANGVVHRDLKTSNIMLQVAGDDQYVKVLDFGIAKIVSESGNTLGSLTATGAVFGSPSYMSPEQCMGKNIDARSDLYSLGCVMYECLTGRPPFRGDNPLQTIFKHVNDEPEKITYSDLAGSELAAIITKCLKKSPEERYTNAQALLQTLSQVGTGKLESPALASAPVASVPAAHPAYSRPEPARDRLTGPVRTNAGYQSLRVADESSPDSFTSLMLQHSWKILAAGVVLVLTICLAPGLTQWASNLSHGNAVAGTAGHDAWGASKPNQDMPAGNSAGATAANPSAQSPASSNMVQNGQNANNVGSSASNPVPANQPQAGGDAVATPFGVPYSENTAVDSASSGNPVAISPGSVNNTSAANSTLNSAVNNTTTTSPYATPYTPNASNYAPNATPGVPSAAPYSATVPAAVPGAGLSDRDRQMIMTQLQRVSSNQERLNESIKGQIQSLNGR